MIRAAIAATALALLAGWLAVQITHLFIKTQIGY